MRCGYRSGDLKGKAMGQPLYKVLGGSCGTVEIDFTIGINDPETMASEAIGKAAGVTCMVGCMLETKIAITAGISLVADHRKITEADCDSFLYSNDPEKGMLGAFTFSGSRFTLSEKPGLDLDISF